MTDLLKDLEAVALLAEKATRGPWTEYQDGGDDGKECGVTGNPSGDVADCWLNRYRPDYEVRANASLIAAAVNFLRTHHAEIAEAVSLSRKAERMEDALYQIKTWSEAYPLSVFPEPDWKRAAEVLGAAGMTLDRISAANMRHVIERVQQIADAAIAQHSGREGL